MRPLDPDYESVKALVEAWTPEFTAKALAMTAPIARHDDAAAALLLVAQQLISCAAVEVCFADGARDEAHVRTVLTRIILENMGNVVHMAVEEFRGRASR